MTYKNGTMLIIWVILLVSLAVLALVISLVVRQTQKKEPFTANGNKIVYITAKNPGPIIAAKDSGTTYYAMAGKTPVLIDLIDMKVGTTFTVRNPSTPAGVIIKAGGFTGLLPGRGGVGSETRMLISAETSEQSTITLTSVAYGLWDITNAWGWMVYE